MLCWLTQSPWVTGGGGWMWLQRGTKLWNYVDFDDSKVLFNAEADTLLDLPLGDLLYTDNHALWGRVREVCVAQRVGSVDVCEPWVG